MEEEETLAMQLAHTYAQQATRVMQVALVIAISRYLPLSPAISRYLPLPPAISRYLPPSPAPR